MGEQHGSEIARSNAVGQNGEKEPLLGQKRGYLHNPAMRSTKTPRTSGIGAHSQFDGSALGAINGFSPSCAPIRI
jgi:hypothetical protein